MNPVRQCFCGEAAEDRRINHPKSLRRQYVVDLLEDIRQVQSDAVTAAQTKLCQHAGTQSDFNEQLSVAQALLKYGATAPAILGGIPAITLEDQCLLITSPRQHMAVQQVKAGVSVAIDKPTIERCCAVIERAGPRRPGCVCRSGRPRACVPALPVALIGAAQPLLSSGIKPVKFARSDGCVVARGICNCVRPSLVFVLLGAQNAPTSVVIGHNASSLSKGADPKPPEIPVACRSAPQCVPAIRHARSDRVIPRVAVLAQWLDGP